MANGMEMSLASKKARLVLPVEAGRRDPGVGQPVQRDVVEDVVSREVAGQASVEDLGNEPGLAGAVAVVDRERREIDGRVRQAIQRLRARRHDLGVGDVLRVEGAQLVVRAPLFVRQTGRRRLAAQVPVYLRRRGAGHVGVDAEQLRGGLLTHLLCDRRTPVAALGYEPVVAEALHQYDPGTGDAGGIPAGGGRLGGESVARQRRDDEMERVLGACAVCRRVGERLDDLQLLDDRARPAVRHDERQGVLMLGADMNEMNVQSIDLGHEVREGFELRLALAPVVVGRPVAGECLHRHQRHALRVVADGLAIRPARRCDPATHVVHRLLRDVDLEGSDRLVIGRRSRCGNVSHGSLLSDPWLRSASARAVIRRSAGECPASAVPTSGRASSLASSHS